jgi:dolichyl-phosphate-mannose--protein O-mannosyl transferase
LKYGVEVTGNNPEFIVHPPVGKWLLIGAGIAIFGDNEFGWRFATALIGTILILVFARLVHVLFTHHFSTGLGAALMALDGPTACAFTYCAAGFVFNFLCSV